jgi:hypothetical protein
VIWHFDLELMNKELDWYRDSMFYTIWNKPDLMIKVKPVSRS